MKLGELIIKKYEYNNDNHIINEEYKKESLKVIFPMLLFLFLFFAEFIYYICAFSIDTYKYPTMFLILFLVLSMVLRYKPAKKLEDIGVEEFRKNLYKTKKYSFQSFIYQIIYLSYFSYMFYVLVFINK
jgi:hypothetical protein